MERFGKCKGVDLLVVAGESSGDEHAANLVNGVKSLHAGLVVAALGGPKLERVGAMMLDDLTAHAVVGVWEVIKRLPSFIKLLDETVAWVAANEPRVIVMVDFVGFNLELAKRLCEKKLSEKGGGKTKVLFYVSPQIWAWKKNRRFAMAKTLTSLGCIFPFEVDCYRDTMLDVSFVGHPFVTEGFVNPISYDPTGAILLLPGSRAAIVAKHLPVLWAAAKLYKASHPRAHFVGYFASPALREQMSHLTDNELELLPAQTPIAARAALTTAGTISLLTALAGVPTSVIYKTDPLTYAVGKWALGLKNLAMPNILLKRTAQEEVLQSQATPEKFCAELDRLQTPSVVALAGSDKLALEALLRQPFDKSAAAWVAHALN